MTVLALIAFVRCAVHLWAVTHIRTRFLLQSGVTGSSMACAR